MKKIIALGLSSILLIILYYFFSTSISKWVWFGIWLVLYTISLVFAFKGINASFKQNIKEIISKDRKIIIFLILLFVLAIIPYFSEYPFVVVGDEVRDAPLSGLYMLTYESHDPFGIGPYAASGNFIGVFTAISYTFFGSSDITHRIWGVIFQAILVFFIYLVSHILFTRRVAIMSAIITSFSVFLLHYGRTEILVQLDAVLSAVIIFALIAVHKVGNKYSYLFFGLIAGLSMHFYMGSRLLFFLAVVTIILSKIYIFIRTENRIDFVKKSLIDLFLLTLGILIVVGPSLIYFAVPGNLVGFTGQTSVFWNNTEFLSLGLLDQVWFLLWQYIQAFGVYFIVPVSQYWHFSYPTPLITYPLQPFFVLGFLFLLRNSSKHANKIWFIVAILFLFPILSQVIILTVGASHRLLSIIPFVVIVSAVGLELLIIRASKLGYLIVALILGVYISYSFNGYYFGRYSDIPYDRLGVKEYVIESISNDILLDNPRSKINYIVNNEGYDVLPAHYQEKFYYNSYPNSVEVIDTSRVVELLENQSKEVFSIYATDISDIPHNLQDKFITNTTYCLEKEDFRDVQFECPKDFVGSYSFYKTRF